MQMNRIQNVLLQQPIWSGTYLPLHSSTNDIYVVIGHGKTIRPTITARRQTRNTAHTNSFLRTE